MIVCNIKKIRESPIWRLPILFKILLETTIPFDFVVYFGFL